MACEALIEAIERHFTGLTLLAEAVSQSSDVAAAPAVQLVLGLSGAFWF